MVSDKNIARFKRATKQLNKVMDECKAEQPGLKFHLDGNSSLHMMDGTKAIGEIGDQETIIADEVLDADVGDW